MRSIYLCQACLATYLPPEDMRYESVGLDASPVHCSRCQALGPDVVPGVQLPASILERLVADLNRERPERQIARSVGPRRRGAGNGPASARTRLG